MQTFQYGVGTHKPVVLQSRNAREGKFLGKHEGRICRVPVGLRHLILVLPFGINSNAVTRKMRKGEKMWWKQAF